MSQLDKSETVECRAGVELANQILSRRPVSEASGAD